MKPSLDRLTMTGRRLLGSLSRPAGLTGCVLAAALSLLVCATASSSLAAEAQKLSGHVPALAKGLTPIGRLPADQRMRLAIGLPLRDQAELNVLIEQLYDPASPLYRTYLTPKEFTRRFGPSEQDYQALVDFANAKGFKFKGKDVAPNRMLLDVEGSVADIEKAFNVTMRVYHHPKENRTFYAPDREPSLDLAVSVLHIAGLDNAVLPHPMYHKGTPLKNAAQFLAGGTGAGGLPLGGSGAGGTSLGGSGPAGNYMGGDFRAAYVPGVSLTGAGQSIALFELDGYFASDISTYASMAGLPNVPLQNILLDGFSGTPGAANGEVALDIEMCMCMAPGLTQILVYEGQIPESILNQIAVDDLANQVSTSWFWGTGPSTVVDQIYQEMAAQGQSAFNGSGDWDAWPTGTVDANAPLSNPYITIVGGTTLTTTGPGGAFVSETVWQWGPFATPTGGEGSGGSISTYYAIPAWQQGVNMSTNGGSTTFRNTPDVALTADNIVIVADDGQVEPGTGGTSAATPLWAAFTSLVNEQAVANGQQPVGFLNPALYSIAKNRFLYGQAFHDVVTGNNTNSIMTNLFFAFPGYDLCTGWGSPSTGLINLLAPPTGSVPLLRYVGNSLIGGNGNGVIDPNECNTLLIVLTNYGSITASGVTATLSSPTPGVIITQPTISYPTMLTNTAATNAFHISTAPSFVCGTTVQFNLAVNSAQSFNTARFRFQLASGTPSTPLRFDNSSPVVLPSLGTVNSPVAVSNFPSAIIKATVSVFISDAYDAGLELQLVAPDGTTNILTAGSGASGQNFGIACAPDGARTTFDDAALTQIAAGVAPFAGSYQPQQALATFTGKSGTNVNGIWKLRAMDLYGFGGAINCWSLVLTPATCVDGGGECPGADMGVTMSASPDPIIVDNYVTYTITVTNGGPSGVHSAVLTMLLPAGISLVSANPSQGGWTMAGGVVTFALGAMPALSSATITVVGQAIAQGTFTASATVSSELVDPNPNNNTAAVVDHIHAPTADLAVSVSANPNTVLVGNSVTYTVTAVNNGPSTATGVLVTNTLPAGVSVVSTAVSQGSVSVVGNLVTCNVGTLTNSQSATTTIKVQVLAPGALVETSQITGDQYDPVTGNNSATVTVAAGPTADLAVGVTENPNPVVLTSNLTYYVTVTNLGPSVATGVLLSFVLDPELTLISSTISQGSITANGQALIATIGTVPNGGTVQATIKATPGVPGTVTSTAAVVGTEPDQNPANNNVSVTTQVSYPFVSIVPAGATLTSESFTPPSGIIYNGETVGVSLRLRNAGNVANTNLQATLLTTAGVAPVAPNSPQTFGILQPSGLPVGRPFSFTASGAPGSTITALLQIKDAGVVLTNVGFNFTLPTVLTFSNTNSISIVDYSNAAPYPSSIPVLGVTGTLARVTATLSNFGHTYPQDVDVLLLAPNGATALLMSHAGDSVSTAANLVFDDAASTYLPLFGPLLSGTYHPTAYIGNGFSRVLSPTASVSFSNPAPAGPYSADLTSLAGGDPNGIWSLFVEDDRQSDAGGITNGWTLALTLATPVNPFADLALSVSGPASAVIPANLTYTYTVSNSGPTAATFVVFSNTLPASVAFLSASASQGAVGLISGSVVGNLGSLAVGATATVTLTLVPSAGAVGWLTNSASVAATQIDLNPANNTVSTVTSLGLPAADLAVSDTIAPTPAVVGFPFTNSVVITNVGPGLALNVSLSSLIPANALFVTALTTNGVWSTNGDSFACAFGNVPVNTSVSVALVLSPTTTNAPGAGANPPIVSVVSASTASTDGNLANNSVTNVIPVNNPAASIQAAGATLISEQGTVNGALDIGDTVTVSLALTNAGTVDTSTNLTATLLNSGGVLPQGNPTQVYGIIPHGGSVVANAFSFTVANTAVGSVVATLSLLDVQTLGSGTIVTNTYLVSFSFPLPSTLAKTNSAFIVIPTYGPATPYPSTVNLSGLTGLVSKAVVTLHGLYHTFPSDIEAILVDPAGQAVGLMANDGYSYGVNGLQISFDDSAPGTLPEFAPIVSGTYEPSVHGSLASLPGPAPAAPYATALAALNGTTPNGDWSLYVFDHVQGNSGGITAGWDLRLTTVTPITPATVGLQIQATANGALQLVLNGAPGIIYVLESSSDLVSWTPVSTNTATAIPLVFEINPQAAGLTFYRAVAQP